MVWQSTLLALALASVVVDAAPTDHLRLPFHKRHSGCQGYNIEGCSYPTVGRQGAAATELGTCSSIAIDILKKGGSAADGVIAAGLCVGTVQGYHSGIGGGGFMLIRFNKEDGSHGYEEIDFREIAPAKSYETMFSELGENQTESTIGGLASGVPGEIKGWKLLHDRHGLLPWAELFAPAIDLARNGFLVNKDLHNAIQDFKDDMITQDPLWAEVYAPNGQVVEFGQTMYRKRLANTLEAIANQGPDAFYKPSSKIAANLIKKVKETGGIMTADDLDTYRPIVREPVNTTYRNTKLFSTVAPSSGAIVLSSLKIFEGFDGSFQDNDPEINVTTHRLIEATKFGYGQRSLLSDPKFGNNTQQTELSFLSDAVVEEARSKIITNQTFGTEYYSPSGLVPGPESGTSHLAVVDGSGMAISLTTTVNTAWGSRVMTEDGIILNNQMDDFSQPGQVNSFGFAANPRNFPQGGKRPQSSIASSIGEDLETGELVIATGSAGGSRIITATLQELHHYIDRGLNASQCTHQARWHDQLGGTTYFDYKDLDLNIAGFDNRTVAFLTEMGYNTTWQAPGSTSTSHVIARLPDGQYEASSDPRKSAGYGAAF